MTGFDMHCVNFEGGDNTTAVTGADDALRCDLYGFLLDEHDVAARDACCVCGGGQDRQIGIGATEAPSVAPSVSSSVSPSVSPVIAIATGAPSTAPSSTPSIAPVDASAAVGGGGGSVWIACSVTTAWMLVYSFWWVV